MLHYHGVIHTMHISSFAVVHKLNFVHYLKLQILVQLHKNHDPCKMPSQYDFYNV